MIDTAFPTNAKYSVTEVFTPTTPARVTFIDRVSVNDKLVDALTTPGMQLVVFGHSGTGKTTLLANKLKQLYSTHITTRCMKGTKFSDLIFDAFSQLEIFYKSETSLSSKSVSGFDLTAKYLEISSKISFSRSGERSDKLAPLIPPQLAPQTLGRFLGEAKACWVLEDFHKISATEKIYLSQMMKVFMDMADDFPLLKVIVIGAVDTGREVVECDPEMKNRVAEIPVELMTDDEILSIVKKGEDSLNIEIPESLRKFIVLHANGLPATCHHICLKICRAAGIYETCPSRIGITKSHCDVGLSQYVDGCSDSIKAVFDNALKDRRRSRFQQPSFVLFALTFFDMDGMSRQGILQRIRLTESSFPEQSLKTLLEKLISFEYGNILRYDANSAKYSFTDPVYKAYAMARLKHEQKSSTSTSAVNIAEILEELSNLLSRVKSRPQVSPI